MKLGSQVKHALFALNDIKKCPYCSSLLTKIEVHAKVGHPVDENLG